MKKNKFLIAILFFLSSCAVTGPNYQVFNTTSTQLNNKYEYENSDLKLSYDLWSYGGKLEIHFTNKTDSPLYLDWSKSSFIMNGEALNIYEDQEIQTSSSTLTTGNNNYLQTSKTSAFAKSVTTRNRSISFLPPHSSITQVFFKGAMGEKIDDCDFVLKPKEKEKTLTFSETTTPIKYRFYLGYYKSPTTGTVNFMDTDFWVDKVTLMNEETFDGIALKVSNCNGDSVGRINQLPYQNIKSFYFMDENSVTSTANHSQSTKFKIGSCIGFFGVAIAVVSVILLVGGN